MFLMTIPAGHFKSSMIFIFTALFEYSLNCTPIISGNDYGLIYNPGKFESEKENVEKHKKSLDRHSRIRIILWGVAWQVIVIAISALILFFSYKSQSDIVDVVKNFIIVYCGRSNGNIT